MKKTLIAIAAVAVLGGSVFAACAEPGKATTTTKQAGDVKYSTFSLWENGKMITCVLATNGTIGGLSCVA